MATVVFERSNKQVLLTEDGLEVIERAKSILLEVDSLLSFTSEHVAPLSGKITLGAIPTISPFMLPAFLPKLRKSYPDLSLLIQERQTALLLNDLRQGRIDAALIALPYPADDLCTIPLFDDAFFLACHKDHPLAKKKSIRLSDMKEQKLLLLEEGHCIRDHALSACKMTGGSYSVPFEGTSLQTLLQMVANEIGLTLIPAMSINTGFHRIKNIKIIPFKDESVRRSIGLVYRSTSTKRNDILLLADEIKKYSL